MTKSKGVIFGLIGSTLAGWTTFFPLPAAADTLRTLTVKARKGGAILAPAASPATVPDGLPSDITAQSNVGYLFTGWLFSSGAGTIANWRDPSTTITPASDAVLWATFSPTAGNLVSNADFATGLTGWTTWHQTAAGTVNVSVTPDDEATLSVTGNGPVVFNGGAWQQFNTGGAGNIVTITGYWRTPQPGANMWGEVLAINGARTPVDGTDETDGANNTILLFKNTSAAGWNGSLAKTIPAPVAAPNKYQISFTAAGSVATIILKAGTSSTAAREVLFDNIEVRSVPPAASVSGGVLTGLPSGYTSRSGTFPVTNLIGIDQSPVSHLIYAVSTGVNLYRVDTGGASLGFTSITLGTSISEGRGMTFDSSGNLFIINSAGKIYRMTKTGGGTSSDTFGTATQLIDLPGPPTGETHHDIGGLVYNSVDGKFYVNSGSQTFHGYLADGSFEDFSCTSSRCTARILQYTAGGGYAEWAYGIRNTFGLVVRKADHTLWGTENGPDGACDYAEEFNLLEQNKHYGFPWKYGSDNNGSDAVNPQTGQFACNQNTTVAGLQPDPGGVPRSPALGNYGPDAKPTPSQPGYINGGVYWGFHPHSSPDGGDVYEADQMDPAANKFTPEFQDRFFIARFGILECGGYDDAGFDLVSMRLSEWDDAFTCNTFIRGMGRSIDALAAFNGKLYVLEYDQSNTGCGTNNSPGRIHEITCTIPPNTPNILLSTASLSPTAGLGHNPPDGTFTVSNNGAGTLNYTITDDAAWLSVSPPDGASTGEADNITVTYSTAGLPCGLQHGTITISDPNSANKQLTISVTLTITTVKPDFDCDGDVDLQDFGFLQACYTPAGTGPLPGCEAAELDHDGDVDQGDFAILMNCMSGPNKPAAAGCDGSQ